MIHTRRAMRSCRDPETRKSFLVASWRPPQAAASYGRCRVRAAAGTARSNGNAVPVATAAADAPL